MNAFQVCISIAAIIYAAKLVMEMKRLPELRKLSYSVHVQARTEEAETMDFAVNLYGDESGEDWKKKLETAFEMSEARRGFNNMRMQEEYARIQKEAQEAAKAKEKV